MLSGCQKQQQTPTPQEQTIVHIQTTYDKQAQLHKQFDGTTSYIRNQQKEVLTEVEANDISSIACDQLWTCDIPVPLDATKKRGNSQADDNTHISRYIVYQPIEEIVLFYKQQMELFGWQCWWQTQTGESLLLFQKPYKECAVSIRPSKGRHKHDIIIMQKKLDGNEEKLA